MRYNNLSPQQEHDRRRVNAIKCAQYFQKLGQRLIKGGCKKVDFQRMTIMEIDQWIAMVTEGLGIRQFNK